jgi:HEPN domain-containing protein
MPLDTIIKEWVDLAEKDISTARFLMQMRPRPLEIIGFHCQQSIEKLLKAYMVGHDIEPDKTHDLMVLLKNCMAFDPGFSTLTATCTRLVDYAVKLRYPFKAEISDAKLEQDLVMALDAYIMIKRKISGLNKAQEPPDVK